MLALPTTCLKQHETFRPFKFLIAKRLTLSMLHSQIIRRPVDELERGQDLREVLPRGLEQREDVIKFGKGENDVVR